MDTRSCVTCGKDFTPYHKTTHVACSEKCLRASSQYKERRNAQQRANRAPKPPRATQACLTCGELFTPYRSNNVTCSRSCRDRQPHVVQRQKAWNADPENRERKNAARRVANNEARRAYNFERNLKWNYGITTADYERMFAEQGGVCFLCGSPPKGPGNGAYSSLHVDHDHVTNEVRKLLCGKCNQGVGFFCDDPDLMQRAADYIRRHRIAN